jgi:hypothetical protein
VITTWAQCRSCKHFYNNEEANRTGRFCASFEDAPSEITDGHFDHREPFPGDNGIRWEPKNPGTIHPFDEPEDSDY